ncbi:histidine phosphatase family protein [Streptomyces sp. NBC_01314]|uniref:histidine phosphatase family protein n=1 Tax=Streptomyces sp. NBC_01314 TaxID=2903821 RepID=UPI00308BBBBB|nr:histidine phosphatase family protein [Streptomyces sp. NBC_01314]
MSAPHRDALGEPGSATPAAVPGQDNRHGEALLPRSAVTALWAVRHGQSTANVAFAEAERTGSAGLPVAGRDSDVPLSALGRAQARMLAGWLAGHAPGAGPDLVVCSPYARARQTWEAMAGLTADVPVLVDERLRDREMGVFELHPPGALAAVAPDEAVRRTLLGEWSYRPPGGEALADVALRVRDFTTELARAAADRRVLVVAHDAIVIALRYVLAGLGAPVPHDLPPVPNASVTHWRGDGHHLRLAHWGQTAHLTDLALPEGTA